MADFSSDTCRSRGYRSAPVFCLQHQLGTHKIIVIRGECRFRTPRNVKSSDGFRLYWVEPGKKQHIKHNPISADRLYISNHVSRSVATQIQHSARENRCFAFLLRLISLAHRPFILSEAEFANLVRLRSKFIYLFIDLIGVLRPGQKVYIKNRGPILNDRGSMLNDSVCTLTDRMSMLKDTGRILKDWRYMLHDSRSVLKGKGVNDKISVKRRCLIDPTHLFTMFESSKLSPPKLIALSFHHLGVL